MRTRRGPFCKNDRKRLGCGLTKNSKKLGKSREISDFTTFLEHRNSIDATDFRESNMPFYRKQFNYLRSGVLNNHTPFYLNS